MSKEGMRRELKRGGGRVERLSVYWLILAGITLCGLILRVLCCFWGSPHQLHYSEKVMLGHALDMLSRHSWEANVYNRPDQFEIKCISIIFFLFSRLKYHMGVSEAYRLHTAAFHLVGRLFITAFGTAMIPLTALFTGKVLQRDEMQGRFRRGAQLLAAGITAFFPLFVQNSAYFDPDIPLACLSMLVAYLSLFYLESGSKKLLCAMAVLIGICVTIKYPGALLSLYLALIVIYRAMRRREFATILPAAGLSAGLVLLTMFIIAPNLFTNLPTTLSTLIFEARPNHLGADGLGFGGNLRYYLSEMVKGGGVISLLLALLGVAYLIVRRKSPHLGLVLFGIYWVCMSKVSLHWDRWGMPMYSGYIILTSIGGAWLLELLSLRLQKRRWRGLCVGVASLCLVVLGVNVALSGVALTKWSLAKDTRLVAADECERLGLTEENTLYEGYTPFDERHSNPEWEKFTFQDGALKMADDCSSKRYFIMSSSHSDRYFAEEERYPEPCAVYRALDDNFRRIYTLKGYKLEYIAFEPVNLADKLRYLMKPAGPTGNDIYIYDLKAQPEP